MKCLVCGEAKTDPQSLTCHACGESSWDMTDEAPKRKAGRPKKEKPEEKPEEAEK